MNYHLPQKHQPLWDLALPYQDKRNDKGHAFIVTMYAQDICTREHTNPDIVVPAAILHDVGWSKVSETERMSVFTHGVAPEKRLEIRLAHQQASVYIAGEFLHDLNYPPADIEQILEIISQHDTRDGFINANEGAMRDADKLWRYDLYGFLSDSLSGGYDFERDIEHLAKKLEEKDFLYFESSKGLAKDMLASLREKFVVL